jgi:uncharacterized membrane protein
LRLNRFCNIFDNLFFFNEQISIKTESWEQIKVLYSQISIMLKWTGERPEMNLPALKLLWDHQAGPVLVILKDDHKISFALICHRRADRSFKIFGHQSLLCSRCTGMCIGLIVAIVLSPIFLLVPTMFRLLFVIPLIVDGFTQLFGFRESNNVLRFITGLLFAIGVLKII